MFALLASNCHLLTNVYNQFFLAWKSVLQENVKLKKFPIFQVYSHLFLKLGWVSISN